MRHRLFVCFLPLLGGVAALLQQAEPGTSRDGVAARGNAGVETHKRGKGGGGGGGGGSDIERLKTQFRVTAEEIAAGFVADAHKISSAFGVPITLQPQVSYDFDGSDHCHTENAYVLDYFGFFRGVDNGLRALSNATAATFAAGLGPAAIAGAVKTSFPPHFLPVGGAVRHLPGSSGGGGGGFGLDFYCGENLIASFGSGGGGGADQLEGSHVTGQSGGGGGGQADELKDGGGGGCSFDDQRLHTCGADGDAGAVFGAAIITRVRDSVAKCPSVTVCGGGGGGLGLISQPLSCRFGAGFSFGIAAVVPTAPSSSSAGAPQASLPTAASCPSDYSRSHNGAVGQAAHKCTRACNGVGNFYSNCFCPCFVSALRSAGVNWASSIRCHY